MHAGAVSNAYCAAEYLTVYLVKCFQRTADILFNKETKSKTILYKKEKG